MSVPRAGGHVIRLSCAGGQQKVNKQPVTARASQPSFISLTLPSTSAILHTAVMDMLFSQQVHCNHYMCIPQTAELFAQVVVILVTRAGI